MAEKDNARKKAKRETMLVRRGGVTVVGEVKADNKETLTVIKKQ